MNADTRMAASLVLSLLISAQNLKMAAMGEADIVAVGIRYIVGFLIVFVLVGLVGRTVNGYVAAHAADGESVDEDAHTSLAIPFDRHDEISPEFGGGEQ